MAMIHPRGQRQQMPTIDIRVEIRIEAVIDTTTDAMVSR